MLQNYRKFIQFVLSDFCYILIISKIKSKRVYRPICLALLRVSLKSRVKVIKHQGEAGEDPEGRVGGLWCSLVASGLTTGHGQVGSQPAWCSPAT